MTCRWPTSLRSQLILIPTCILFAGLLGSVGTVLLDAQARIAAEIRSSMQLGEDLVATALRNVADATSPALALEQLNQDLPHVRHVQFDVAPSDAGLFRAAHLQIGPVAPRSPSWLVWLLAPAPEQQVFPVIVRGETVGEIRLRSNPADEIAEITDEVELLCGVPVALCLLIVGTLLWALRRSLGSVQLLEDGLNRLAKGDYRSIPLIPVRELRRVGQQLNFLVQSLRRLTADNSLLIDKLISVQERERKELAADLHDEFGPALFGIRAEAACILKLASADPQGRKIHTHARAVAELTDGVQKVNARILGRLRPLVLEQMGLPEALRQTVLSWQARCLDIAWSVQIPWHFEEPSEPLSLALYRIAQEAITNAVRHAGATTIEIRLERHESETEPAVIHLSVRDNGNGLPEQLRYGFGLLGMRERVRQLDGTLEITQAVPSGLVVRALIREQAQFTSQELVHADPAD